MDVGRRAFMGGSAAVATSAAAQQWADLFPKREQDASMPPWAAEERFAIWPGRPPGAPAKAIAPQWAMEGPPERRFLLLRGVPMPEVHVFRPAKPDGSAVLVIPGGGYWVLAAQHEGSEIARFFNTRGITAFVLTYRLPAEGWSDRHLVPLQDAQRAMRLIRHRAATFAIDPARLGVLGFSAGGHLAADVSVSHSERTYSPVDEADAKSARPAFTGLIYAVTALLPEFTHQGSRDNLLGPNPDSARIRARSPVLHVGKDAPPSFLVHAADDGGVPLANSLKWLEASRAAGVPCEAHIFAEGEHGFGLRLATDMPASRWGELFALWMRKNRR